LRFSEKIDIHNRLVCMELLGEAGGSQECLDAPENQHDSKFHFSYYSKYLCLYWREVETDAKPWGCLVDWLDTADYDYELRDGASFDLPFVAINECLEAYEKTPDT
jgi:hypothetical protein